MSLPFQPISVDEMEWDPLRLTVSPFPLTVSFKFTEALPWCATKVNPRKCAMRMPRTRVVGSPSADNENKRVCIVG